MASKLEVSVRRDEPSAGRGGSLAVVIDGELDISTAPKLVACTDKLFDDDVGLIVIDVSQLSFVDVAGLRLLIALRARAKEQLTSVRLVGASAHLQRVLKIVSPVESFLTSGRFTFAAPPAADRPPG